MSELQILASNASTIGNRMSAWIAEATELQMLSTLTPKQKKRLGDLNAALDTYAAHLEHPAQLPDSALIDRVVM